MPAPQVSTRSARMAPSHPTEEIAVFTATVAVSLLLALIATMSAVLKFQRHDQVVGSIHGTVGVPLERLPLLAALELLGAAGLIVGLWFAPIGIAAAIGLILYFVGAVIGHVRVGDTAGISSPMFPLSLSIVALVLRLLTA